MVVAVDPDSIPLQPAQDIQLEAVLDDRARDLICWEP